MNAVNNNVRLQKHAVCKGRYVGNFGYCLIVVPEKLYESKYSRIDQV